MDLLSRYDWPGNIRELQNVVERAVVLSRGPILKLGANLLPATSAGGTSAADVPGLDLDRHKPEEAIGGSSSLDSCANRGTLEYQHLSAVCSSSRGYSAKCAFTFEWAQFRAQCWKRDPRMVCGIVAKRH